MNLEHVDTPLRVLVADDSRDTADSAALMIGLWGHDCRPAYGGAEAVALAEQYRPHLVLADLAMPGLDGLELARRLGELPERPTLVAVSGFADAAHRRAAAEAGFDLFLPKPTDPHELRRLLDQAAQALRACGRAAGLADRTERLQDESWALIRELRRPVRLDGSASPAVAT